MSLVNLTTQIYINEIFLKLTPRGQNANFCGQFYQMNYSLLLEASNSFFCLDFWSNFYFLFYWITKIILACTKNTFKSSEGNAQCRQCPRFSTAPYSAAHECSCDPGFYRAQGEGADEPCSTTPSAPRDLTSEVNESRVNLSWMAPASRGDRDDLFYEVQCESCSSQSGTDCKKCPSNVIITPNWRVSTNNVQVSNLDPAQFYRLKVISKNGVSKISSSDPEYAEIMARTAFKPPTGIANVNLKDIREGDKKIWRCRESNLRSI